MDKNQNRDTLQKSKLKVAILCGGIGARLREETEFRPKPMVYIGDRPILWHIMKIYSQFGFDEFVLALGYKGEIIKDYFYHYALMNKAVTIELGKPRNLEIHQCHEETSWKITLVETGENALKGARIKRLEPYITGDTFLLTYGDGIADVDIDELIRFHRSHGKMMTLTGINPTSRFGELKLDGDRVISFSEKPQTHEGFINGGFFVCNRRIFEYLNDDDRCDFEFGPLEEIARMGEMMVFRHDGFWACMDTLRDRDYLNSLWNENQAAWKNW